MRLYTLAMTGYVYKLRFVDVKFICSAEREKGRIIMRSNDRLGIIPVGFQQKAKEPLVSTDGGSKR